MRNEKMTKSVEVYLKEGCGRCSLGGTPDCKVHTWIDILKRLRQIMLDCGLNEESKWGVPVYTLNGNNVLNVSALKEYAAIGFFKGSLLQDEKSTLEKPGPNSQAVRLFKFTSIDQIIEMEETIKAYVFEAIEVEKLGLEVQFKKEPEPIPEELEAKFEDDPTLKTAFEALTPGRQRGYILHFLQPKQSKTRASRIEKCIPKIMEGKGFHDR